VTLRVAAGQGVAVAGDLAANVATAVRLVQRAADDGAGLLILPESFLLGYDLDVFAGDLPRADELLADPRLDPLAAAAGAGDLTVLVGAAVRREDGARLSLLRVRPDGARDLPYDKQHLDADETRFFVPGDHGTSITVDGLQVGLSICYDGCFPEHARAAAADGAVGYLASAAYFAGGAHRRDVYYAARAVENGLYVVFAGLTGPCGPARFCGGSAIYDPEGRPLVRLGEEEGVAVADVDAALVAATRERHTMLRDHRDSLGPRIRA